MDEEQQAVLSVPELMRIARISRSTAMRWLHAGRFPGARKRHACDGSICRTPLACQHGTWEVPEADVEQLYGVR